MWIKTKLHDKLFHSTHTQKSNSLLLGFKISSSFQKHLFSAFYYVVIADWLATLQSLSSQRRQFTSANGRIRKVNANTHHLFLIKNK